MIPAFAVVLAAVIVVAVVVHRQPRSPAGPFAGGPQDVPADVLRGLTEIPLRTFDAVGVAGGVRPALAGPPESSGPPVVLYVGAEYCPYCAAMRWSLIVALARFGSFTGLGLSVSSPTDIFPKTPTFTFLHARYQSPYLTLQTVELQGNARDAAGNYPPLQQLTPTQAALSERYDRSRQIPFLLVGGAYAWVGAPFSPGLLDGADWRTIASALPAGQGAAAKAILVGANEMTAAICAVDGNAPAAVCRSTAVGQAAQTLPGRP